MGAYGKRSMSSKRRKSARVWPTLVRLYARYGPRALERSIRSPDKLHQTVTRRFGDSPAKRDTPRGLATPLTTAEPPGPADAFVEGTTPAGGFANRRASARSLTWVYRAGAVKSGTIMRGEQLSEMVKHGIGEAVVVRYMSEQEVRTVADSVVILTTSFIKDATPDEIDNLRRRRNIICIDYLDYAPRKELVEVVDVYIASSIAQLNHFKARYPDKLIHMITHHADPLIRGIRGPDDYCNIGYFGEIGNARYREELQGVIDFTQTNNSEIGGKDWIQRLRHCNVHYAVREYRYPTPNPPPDAFKPFTKGFTAAQCHSNIIVPLHESDASYYLGKEYPFVLKDDSLKAVREMIEFAKESFRGPEWYRGLEIMALVRHKSSPKQILNEVQALLQKCS